MLAFQTPLDNGFTEHKAIALKHDMSMVIRKDGFDGIKFKH